VSAEGHCLCGAVRYAIEGEIGPPVACHCQYCRRAHGAPFSVVGLVRSADFRFTSGEEAVKVYETPGGGARSFCSLCGTRIANHPRKFPASLSVVLGTLADELERPPVLHINVESKARWFEIPDGAPRFDALPPAADTALDRNEA
jgi:hypothetical protein